MLSNPRTRIINFRLSEEEFDQLKAACESQGSRCLSDFARSSVLASAAGQERPLAERLAGLDERICSLDARIGRILERLELAAASKDA